MDSCDRMKASSSSRNHDGKLAVAIHLENFSQQCSASATAGPYPYISDSSDLELSTGGANSIESTQAPVVMFRNHPYVVTASSITTKTTTANSSSFITRGNQPQPVQGPPMVASSISSSSSPSELLQNRSSMETMREMIFRIAMMQPIHIDPESVKPPRRKNVKISKDPQSVAARHRRERISERIRILQRLVPGGTKMDTASMLDEAAHYLKFLKKQVQSLEQQAGVGAPPPANSSSSSRTSTRATPLINSCINPMTMTNAATMNYSNLNFIKSCCQTPPPPSPPPHHHMMMGTMQMLS